MLNISTSYSYFKTSFNKDKILFVAMFAATSGAIPTSHCFLKSGCCQGLGAGWGLGLEAARRNTIGLAKGRERTRTSLCTLCGKLWWVI